MSPNDARYFGKDVEFYVEKSDVRKAIQTFPYQWWTGYFGIGLVKDVYKNFEHVLARIDHIELIVKRIDISC